MPRRTSQYRTGGGTAVAWIMAAFLLLLSRDGPADAYIDPGTGGAMFTSIMPILAMIGVLAAAALGFARTYVMRALGFIWRLRWVVVALAVVIVVAIAAVCFILISLRGAVSTVHEGRRRRDMTQAKKLLVQRGRELVRPAERFHLFKEGQCPETPRQKVMLGDVSRSCFVFEQSGTVETEVRPLQRQSLLCYVASEFPKQAQQNEPITFELRASGQQGKEDVLFKTTLARPAEQTATPWRCVRASLDAYQGKPISLRFVVSMGESASGSAGSPTCYVSDPRLIGENAGGRPNVILLTIETLRRDHTSLYGYSRKTTPFLEELAKEAVVFDESYSQSSWTRASVSTLLTGLHPIEHRTVIALDALPGDIVCLPELFRAEGYTTGAFVTNELLRHPVFNYDQGFDLFVDEHLYPLGDIREDIVQWLDEAPAKPFFMWIHAYDPHSPYEAPEPFRRFYDKEYNGRLAENILEVPKLKKDKGRFTARDIAYVIARYDEGIRYTDEVIKELVADLRQRNLWDDTLLVITSDHGEELYEHGRWGHGRNLFPEKLRVPLLVKLPGSKHGGIRMKGIASGVDVAPTLLKAAGMSVPHQMRGFNLLANVATTMDTGRRQHLPEYWAARVTDVKRGDYDITRFHCARITKNVFYSFVETNEKYERYNLFDLQKDPAAKHNLAYARPELRKELHNQLMDIFRRGYTLAARGGEDAGLIVGTISSEARIVQVERERLESDDQVSRSSDGRSLRLRLNVHNDDDLLRFRTEPEVAAVSFEIQAQGTDPLPIYVGPDRVSATDAPLIAPSQRCPLDAPFGVIPRCPGEGTAGIFIWRQGLPVAKRRRAASTEQETLRNLKDLGYL
ncbi:MAG: sulfatase [Planctomycetes bacterium]|nr:sulfatase [Planctomycetota bacterium]